MLLLLLDLHRNIFSAQGVIQYATSKPASYIEITLKADYISLIIYLNSAISQKLNIALPDDLLQPHTISSVCSENLKSFIVNKESRTVKWSSLLDQNSFKVTFRTRISEKSDIDKWVSKSPSIAKFKDFMKDKFEVLQVYDIICTSCNNVLSDKQISFQSVYEYHEDMSELSDTWFCHKHNDQVCFQPKKDSLYIGDTCFYFHDTIIRNLTLFSNSKMYKCIKCHSVLSLKTKMNNPNYIGFFSDKIMFQKSGTSMNDTVKYKNEVALFSFYNIFQDVVKSTVTCKLYLQCKVEEQIECLLLWANSPKILQFLLHEMNNDDSFVTELKAKEVYKVLYSFCSADSQVAKKWKHDFSVDFFQISDNTMKFIKELLKEGLKFLYDDQKTADGFSFGYLPVYSYDAPSDY